jgi:enoyl-CoA hydratase
MASDGSLVVYENRGRIAILRLNRPPVNALNTPLWEAISDAFNRLAEDTSAHVAILTAEGHRAFCAGADIKELQLPGFEDRSRQHQETMEKMANTPVPVICAINGPAIGAGIVLSSLCDIRIAADNAHFSWTEIDRGLVSGGGVHLRKIGVRSGMIRELLFTGRKYTADEAFVYGAVDHLVPSDQLMPTALELAERIASKPRQALVATKKAILEVEVTADWRQAYANANQHAKGLRHLAETEEGIAAFIEKREPKYAR